MACECGSRTPHLKISCEYMLNKQSWIADQEWSSSLGFFVRLTTTLCKNILVQKHDTRTRNSTDNLKRPCQSLGVDGRTLFEWIIKKYVTIPYISPTLVRWSFISSANCKWNQHSVRRTWPSVSCCAKGLLLGIGKPFAGETYEPCAAAEKAWS